MRIKVEIEIIVKDEDLDCLTIETNIQEAIDEIDKFIVIDTQVKKVQRQRNDDT